MLIDFPSRSRIAESLIADIHSSLANGIQPQSRIISGEAGSGKTVLLKQLIESFPKEKLKTQNHGIELLVLPKVMSGPLLSKLFEEIIEEHLETRKMSIKGLVIFIDDLDLGLKDSVDDQALLRTFLLESKLPISIIATARDTRFLSDYSKPLFRFFGVPLVLEPLELDEISNYLTSSIQGKLLFQLETMNSAWREILTNRSPRRVKLLKETMLFFNQTSDVLDENVSRDFLNHYLNYFEEYFNQIFLDLPPFQRSILEMSALQPAEFHSADLNMEVSNISHQIKVLIKKGHLSSKSRGIFYFEDTLFKIWIRYIKQVPIGRCINPQLGVLNWNRIVYLK